MKRIKGRLLPAFVLIMIMCWGFLGITVYGGPCTYLINDTGSSPGSWENVCNLVASTSYLKEGPSSGNPGSYYYFKTSGGSREMEDAIITREITLSPEQRMLCDAKQLKANFSLDYFGWDDRDDDEFIVRINSHKEVGWSEIYNSGHRSGDQKWRKLAMPEKILPEGTVKIQVVITAFRRSGSDLDVYLDNICLSVYDDTLPVMKSAEVTEIRDWYNAAVPLKRDPGTGTYLENWVNTRDAIYGEIKHNEPVRIYNYYGNLNTNIKNSDGSKKYAYTSSNDMYSYLYSHEFIIYLRNAERLKEGDSTIKFTDSDWTSGTGPFNYSVCDLGGNEKQSNKVQYNSEINLEKYNLKLDNAYPTIITPRDSYEKYEPGRTSVDVVVREEDRGTEQSPLTLTYYWEYYNLSNVKVKEEEKEILVSSTIVPVRDETSTTYTVKIDIPNGSTIPPYQDFKLYAKAEDEARNAMYVESSRSYVVGQKDTTPPGITWDKSVHEDGTEVNLAVEEDTGYAMSRTVSFSANDLESGVEEVKYLWTKEPYPSYYTEKIPQVVLPGEDGKYEVQGTSLDAPLEGKNYLSILAANCTGTSIITSKEFYFDNQGPSVYDVGGFSINPESVRYRIQDRALQGKFLYTIATYDISTGTYEVPSEPNISEGLKNDGMWRALELDGTEGTERIADITGVVDKITQSGYYKLFTRFYDEYYNCTEIEHEIWYDFLPPIIEVINSGEPEVFQKYHDIVLDIKDNMVGVPTEETSISWIDAESGEEIPASFEITGPSQHWIGMISSDGLSGKYYLKVRARDAIDNMMEETVSIDGRWAEYCFDNSPPEVILAYDTKMAVNKIRFEYSELKDDYTGISLFQYGISASPEIDPTEWIDIDTSLSSGGISYPYEFAEDGEWYLHIMLQDILGNEQRICSPDPFRVDSTKPSGGIVLSSGYINKLDVPLQLEIDELKSTERESFKTILSGDRTLLEGAEIPDVELTDWKDICYEKGMAVYSWKLADMPDGEQRIYARFTDEAGNLSDIYEAGIILDRTAPTAEIHYDVTGPTTGDVTATLTTADNYNVILLNNNQVSSYVFNRNGEFEFVLTDEARNKTRAKAVVSNIDRDPPEAAITYSHPRDVWTNESITATLSLADKNGFTILGDGTSTHTFDENGEFVFLFEDTLGNQGSIKAEVKNIDKKAPAGSIIYTYSDTAPVTVYLAVYEPVEVTNNEGSFRHVFDKNGEFTFEFEDKAGNAGTATAAVDTITSLEKYVSVDYSDSGRLTKEDINAEFTAFSGLSCITSPTVTEEVYGPYTYSFSENGDCPVSIRVLSGEEEGDVRIAAGSVYNIDRVPPEAEVYISTNELTNRNVTATLLPYDDKGKSITIENNNGESEYEFTGIGTFTFDFVDEAGNVGHKTVTVSNIDKSVPVAGLRYFTEESKENSVFAEVYFPDETGEVEILNNNGSNTFEFVENGTFTFRFADKAGNEGNATAKVESLSDSVSAGTIKYYVGEAEIADPNVGITNKSVTAKLVLDEGYVITNNGGSSSYTFEKNGEYTFVYGDSKGNRGFATAKVSIIDKETPKLQILADTVKATNRNVTITVSYSDNKEISEVRHNMEAENLTSSEGKLVYTCKDNKTIKVTVVDTAGNETTKEFEVNYIDKEMPIGTIIYTPNRITNQNVKAVLILNEPGLILNNSGRMEYIFTQNGDFTFEFADIAGNSTTMTASVNWIDKTPLVAALEYSNTSTTNQPVTVTVKANKDFIVLNNGGAVKRTFYTNGEFTFRVADIAGNEVSIKAEVRNIDTDKPQITLKGPSYVSIFQNEAYVEPGYTAFDNIDGDMTSKVSIEGSVNTEVPGIYILKYGVSDAVGNSSEKRRIVKVLGPDEIVLLLNGKVAEGECIILEDINVNASCLGNEGSYVIKWAKGRRTQAYFKTEGNNIAAGATVRLETGSWHTFYIQDRERKIKCIQVYINK